MRWPAIAIFGVSAALLWLGWALYDTLFPIFLGFALAYAFDPLADWMEEQGLGRTTAVSLILLAVGAAVAVAIALIIPTLISEGREFVGDFPRYAAAAHDRLTAFLQPWGVRLPNDKEALLARLRDWLQGVSVAALAPAGVFATRFFSTLAGTLTGLLSLIVVPVVFFYFLRDISAIRESVLSVVPPRHRRAAVARLDEADRVFSGYLRGQMTVALILAGIYSIGLTIAGIRFGILIGIASGLLNFVPYLGVALGLGASLVMAAVDASLGGALAVLAVFGVAQALEGFVITPKIVGDKVGLGPVETIVALILGGEFGGLPGMILAIPVAGCLKVWAADGIDFWKRTAAFRRV
ncbi:MAG: AI-2E family transporter [Elusimicrobia bacterium]|nr:AI-2E family transporter [Elusimicrobiota bacterium]